MSYSHKKNSNLAEGKGPHATSAEALAARRNSKDLSAWIGASFVDDMDRTVALAESQRADGPNFVGSPLKALKEVSLGNADVAIENLTAATYPIKKIGLTNLKIAAPTSSENYALSIAVRKDWPELVGILNKGLASISNEKHNEIRQRWIAVRYEHGLSSWDIVKGVLIVAAVSSAALFTES